MSQIRLHVMTNEQIANLLLDSLEIEFEDDGFAISSIESDPENKIWNVSIYIDGSGENAEQEARLRFRNVIDQANLQSEIIAENLPDIDWLAHTLSALKPIEVGRFIIHGSHDRHAIKSHQLAIEINAAQAFGTGHHGTTAGCLEMIEMTAKRSHTGLRSLCPVLDLGTGSGVLAIAAAKLGTGKILATDIDPIAIKTAKDNASFNQVGHLISFETVNGLSSPVFTKKGPFGLIVANILARPLMRMAPDIANNLMPSGTIILSGILAEQRWKVLSAFNRYGLAHIRTIWRDGWVTIVLK